MTSFGARTHPRALGTALSRRRCGRGAYPAASLPEFVPQGQPGTLQLCPRSPLAVSPAEMLRPEAAGGHPAPRHLNPSFNVSSLICRCRGESREKHKGRRDNPSPVAPGRGETRPPEGLALLPGYRHAPLPPPQLPPSITGAGQGSEPSFWRGTRTSLLHPGLRARTALLGLTP